MDDDLNYNSRITFEDSTDLLIYINKLSNEGLHKWQGWHCAAGVTAIHIYKNEVYGGECRNDLLGYLDQDWNLIDNYTVCKLDQCGCTTDMLQEKYKP
jgi:hypothetical protein